MNKPKPFCFNRSKIKAIVLGCDPTNKTNKGERVPLEFVFGIGKDARYFYHILDNLNQLDLHLEDLYIQNLITEYQDHETSQNKNWENKAEYSVMEKIKEFSQIDPQEMLPVFLTSFELYKVLLNDNIFCHSPEELYRLEVSVPVLPNENKLGRRLFPLFRNPKYNLSAWPNYKQHIIKHLKPIENDFK